MSFSINTNVASLSAQNYLRVNSDFQNKTINRVTSGLRIVQSGDDAAGLAIANGYRSDQAVLTQGVRNANDGMSQLQIIDGGMSNISQLLDRARTLATQSATGTFTGNRSVLNDEFQSVLGEIDRQAQSIGLDTGGIFAKNLSVFIGGGKDSGSVNAISNGSVSVNLSQSTVDSRSLGLKGVQVIGASGTDIGAGSGLTSLSSILANTTNIGSEAAPDTATFYLKGPGFDSQGVKISVNTKNIGGTSDLVAAINTAIQSAANGGTQQGTALKNANITASINTDSAGRQQLTFNSGVAAFQVQAGDQMANALMGNFKPLNAAAQGTDTQSTLNTTGHGTIAFQFDGNSGSTITVSTVPQGTGTTKTAIMNALNADSNFHAAATATLNGNQLVITSKNSTSTSAVKVLDGGAGSLSRLVGLTTNGDATTGASSASTGANLATTVLGSSVTGTGSTQFTAANAGNITVRFTGAGLTSPVDITVAAASGETLTSVVNDLNTQVSSNSALKAAGISLDPSYNNLDGNHQLLFKSTGGQAFHVDVTGDTTNQLGFGSFQAGNTVSGNNGAFDYTTLTGTSYSTGTANVQGPTAGTATLQFSLNGQASNTNNIDVNLATLSTATAATVTGSQTIASPVTINAAGGVDASLKVGDPIAASATIGTAVAASTTLGAGNAGITFTASTPGSGGNSLAVVFQHSGNNSALSASYAANTLTVNLATDGSGSITSIASDVTTLLAGAGTWTGHLTAALTGTGASTVADHVSTSLTGGNDPQLVFTASTPGAAGNNLNITFQHSGNSSPLSYVTTGNGNNIVVNLATSGGGAITSTASDVIALLNGQAGLNVALASGASGSDLMTNSGPTSLTGGGDAGLTFTAKTAGTAGNNITVQLTHSGNNSSRSVTVTGNQIVVNLATDGSGNIAASNTASTIASLINGDPNASPLVTVGLVGTGSNVVADQAQTNLSGGAASGANANNELNLVVGGTAYNVQLASGANTTLNSIAQQINSAISATGTASVQNNQLVIASTLKGAGAAVTVEQGSANALLGLNSGTTTYGTSATGTDIASYLNQQFAANNNLQKAGLQASFAGGQLTIASNNGTNFRINEIASTTSSAQTIGTASFTTQATSAVVQGGSGGQVNGTGNFNFATAAALKFTVNGTSQTVNFGVKNYTKQQVLDAINSQSTLATASWDSATGKIQIVAKATGTGSPIVIDTDTNSTANSVLGFSAGATADGTASSNTTDVTAANDTLNLKINGVQLSPITLTHGTAALGTARTMANVASDLTTAFGLQNVAATATVVDGHLKISSTLTGPNSTVEIQAGNANSLLGLSVGTTQASDTNIGFGASGVSFTGNTSSGAAVSSPQVDAGGASQTTALSFTPLLYGTDSQTITIAGNNAAGAQQSISMVLQNNGANRSGRSIDEAISAINTQLQQSNNSTLQQIVAVKDDAGGTEQIKFMSTLGSFQVSVGSNGNVTGLGATAPGVPTNPPQQGSTVTSATANGGSTADISNQSSAQAAVTALANAVTTLGSAQAVVGRGENTFNYAVNLAQSQLTNLATAESRIRDADLASEAANLTKAQILMQAGVAALAQANSAPQQVLTLLRG